MGRTVATVLNMRSERSEDLMRGADPQRGSGPFDGIERVSVRSIAERTLVTHHFASKRGGSRGGR